MKDLRDKVMLITGAASGIGRACALEFADRGCYLVICDINDTDLDTVAGEIRRKGRRVLAMKTDVSDEQGVAALADRAFQEFGKVDIAMSNAGIAVVSPTHELERADWDRVMGVNFYGAVHVIRYFVPPMVERREGHLVVTASGMGLTGMPYAATYTVSKFALVGLTESLRPEMALHNVGVTTLCPAVVHTPMFQRAELRGFSDEARRGLMGGMSPERFARIVVKGVKKNKGLMVISGLTKTTYGFKRLSPSLYEWSLKGWARISQKYRDDRGAGFGKDS